MMPNRARGYLARALVVAALGACATSRVEPPAPRSIAPAASTSASATAITSASAVPPPSPPRLDVHLVPLGDVDDQTLLDAADALRAHAPVDVAIEAREALPASAMSTEKNRYRAEKLLDFLATLPIVLSADKGKVMGVAALDIVTEKNGSLNWGILGLGAIDGTASVISTYRMKRAWEKGGGASEELVHARLWKITLHELGHTLGLPHCPNVACIMEDAGGTVKTVDAEEALCADCQSRFNAALVAGSATSSKPLPP